MIEHSISPDWSEHHRLHLLILLINGPFAYRSVFLFKRKQFNSFLFRTTAILRNVFLRRDDCHLPTEGTSNRICQVQQKADQSALPQRNQSRFIELYATSLLECWLSTSSLELSDLRLVHCRYALSNIAKTSKYFSAQCTFFLLSNFYIMFFFQTFRCNWI